MLRGFAKHCVAGRHAVQIRQCAEISVVHRKELAPRTSEPGKPPTAIDRTPRSGTVIHKLTNFPGVYDVNRIVRAFNACAEPAYYDDLIQVEFYCLLGDTRDKFRTVGSQSVMPFPEFGKTASVGLFTHGPLRDELENEFHHIVHKDDLTNFFTRVHKGEEELCDIYVCTSGVEMFLKRFGTVLREKTPSAKKGLVADKVHKMQEVLRRARFLRRFEIKSDGICTVHVGSLGFSAEQVTENIQHIGFHLKDLMNREDEKFLEYLILRHGRTAFCVDLQSVGLDF